MSRPPSPCPAMVWFVVLYNKIVTYFMTKYVETKYSNKQYNKIEDQVF